MENYSYNEVHMLLSRGSNAYVNDTNGNTLTGGGRNNTWDSQNRLVQCITGTSTCQYGYGADGLRHHSTISNGQTTTTTDFVLDGQSVVRERQNGANTATYLTGPTGPLYRRNDVDGSIRWYVLDGLGSVVGEVDPSGNLTAARACDVYGATRGASGTATSKHGFVGSLGHTTEPETGLVYMRARFYDPAVGRFVSEDPAGSGGNWYTYASDNPVNGVDPTGLATLQDQVAACAIAGEMAAEAGDGAIAAEQNMASQLGEAVAYHELQICQWLEGAAEYAGGVGSDITEFTLKMTNEGIEITSGQGSSFRRVFIDIVNKYGEIDSNHIQGIHLDFQVVMLKGQQCWKQIALGMDSFPGWRQ